MRPLYEALKATTPIQAIDWTAEAESAFTEVKTAFAQAALLAHPSSTAPISITTDASDYAVGAVHEQWVEGAWQPLAFFSYQLTPRERNNIESSKGKVKTVANALVDMDKDDSREEDIGAGEPEGTLAIVPVKVKTKQGNTIITTYAFLDPGSTATFCTESILQQLQVTGRNTKILLRTMNKEESVKTSVACDLEICGLESNQYVALPPVYSQKKIPVRKANIPSQEDVGQWEYLKEVNIPQIDAEVGLLIGCNVPKALEPCKVINSQGNGPYAVKTILGWTINGPLGRSDTTRWIKPVVTANRISVVEIEELLKQQVKLDFPEHQHKERLEMSREDHKFMESVSNSVKLVDGHYSIGLPLKEKGLDFPNNRRVAEQKDKANQSKRSWYIPHHGVYHPKKRKLRVVFDCGATYQGTSLNARLLQGPDLTNSLIGVLTRFRQKNIAFMADIEAMFHQVKVPEEDSDLLTFLWWPDGDLSSELEEYQMVVHIFGATSSPSCANFALQQCARDNVDDFSPEAVSSMLRNFYVDHCLKSMEDERKAVIIAHELKTLCRNSVV
ncbi:uncharacterized protein LOC117547890 [Gymnodraco acuticeps]|uniref:Uncharacterized protein LOC117547890 n=1 Tax=Gymnodraco acuticeps TaxID=8218 RepID=A0A6P8UCL5_GYMAC|nr:uncharacterized protein LOC117547890 [Gymnodraco acuticeps]